MARMYSSGFELQSADSLGKEYSYFQINGSNNSPGSISTSIKRTGAASLRVNGTIATGTNGIGVGQDIYVGTTNRKLWVRAYVRFEAWPGDVAAVMAISDQNLANNVVLAVRSDHKLDFYVWNQAGNNYLIPGSTSVALNLSQWYRLEIFCDTSTSASWAGEFRLDGTTVATFSGQNNSAMGTIACDTFSLFSAAFNTGVTVDQYYDDVACNDANGSVHNSWPGAGSIVHMHPDSAGDNNQWLKSDGSAADTNNFNQVDETTPDDGTTYLRRTTSSTPIDDYNCQTSGSAGISAGDTIRLVQVGVRCGATSATITNRTGKLRIKGQASGTLQEGSVVGWNADTTIGNWTTHQVLAAGILGGPYTLTAYTNPQSGAGAAWTPASLDTMQIGMQAAVASVNALRVSAVWALVEFTPGAASALLDLTSALVASTTAIAMASSALVPTSSLALNALRFAFITQVLSASSSLSADTKVYRPAIATLPAVAVLSADVKSMLLGTAVLPGTLAIAVNPKFPNLTSTELALSSSLTAATKQLVAANWTAPATASLLLNTIQYFVASAKLPCDSDLILNESLSLVARATLPAASTLDAATTQFYIPGTITLANTSALQVSAMVLWAATAVISGSSTFQADLSPKFSGEAVLTGNSNLLANSLQIWSASSVIAANSILAADTLQKWNSSAVIAASFGSVIADTLQRLMLAATLPANSSLIVNTKRYTLASAVLASSSALVANTRWYAIANAQLNATSSLSAQATLALQATATLSAFGTVLANAVRYTPVTAVLSAAGSFAADAQRYTLCSSVLSATSSLFANALRYVPATAVLAGSSNLIESDKMLFAAFALVACSSNWSVTTTQTVKWQATVVISGSSDLSAKAVKTILLQSVFPLSSVLSVSFTPLLTPMLATLPMTSFFSATVLPKERNIAADLVGTSTLLAKAAQLFAARVSYTIASDLSALSLQRWNSKSKFDLFSSFQVTPVQKMFESSKWTLSSKFFAYKPMVYVNARSNMILVSTLRVNTIIHEVENHNKTQKHLRGSVSIKHLKGGMAEEVVS